MNSVKRPISVVVIACLYLAVGVLGCIFHFRELLAHHSDAVWIELTELLAIVCGAFLLRGDNWARWLALAWIAFHVVLSAFHNIRELAIHSALCILIAWALFHPGATRYFRGDRT